MKGTTVYQHSPDLADSENYFVWECLDCPAGERDFATWENAADDAQAHACVQGAPI